MVWLESSKKAWLNDPAGGKAEAVVDAVNGMTDSMIKTAVIFLAAA
jgi:hypothetical protein